MIVQSRNHSLPVLERTVKYLARSVVNRPFAVKCVHEPVRISLRITWAKPQLQQL